jgi:hypothetical protein
MQQSLHGAAHVRITLQVLKLGIGKEIQLQGCCQ